jgi:GTPase Era involved in 16S rRNA processing
MTSFSSFTNYKQTVMDITGDLGKLREFSKKMKLEGNTEAIDDVLKRLSEDIFSVAIVGEFKRGKSTLINALLGKDVLPTDVLPCSATLNKISYSVTPFAKIDYRDGRSEEIEIDQLNNYVTKLTKESEERAKSIKEATVFYPVNYCKNGVTIIDTPGLNDDAAMTEVTMGVLPHIDAALMVIMAQSPFSESERDFLENKILTSDLGRVLFVVTGVDLLDEEDAEKVLRNINERIQEHVIAKAKNTFGENSDEFESYKRKIGKVRVYGISAKKALKAKLKNDDEMLKQSFFLEFENALECFLTEDRGAVMLTVPLNRIKSSSMEIVKAIQLRENVLAMNKEEFNAKYKQAMDEIETIRAERQNEFIKINEASQRTYNELIPAIQNYWPTMENAAMCAIDNFPLTNDEIKDPAVTETQERLMNVLKNALARESQMITERIQETISTALESEAERISGFEQHFYDATGKIQNLFVQVDKVNGNDVTTGDAIIATVANTFLLGGIGVGGIYMGFKKAGWKGALLGGATSFAGMVGVGIIAGVLALPVTLPLVIVGGLLGSLTSRFALSKVFGGGDKTEKFKDSFKQNILNELANMKAQDNFSDTVRGQIESAFESLKEKIKTETENILNDTQNQLTDLKVELANASVLEEKEKEELAQIFSVINGICVKAEELSKQLAIVLSR